MNELSELATTGAQGMGMLIAIGAVILVAGIALLILRRRRR